MNPSDWPASWPAVVTPEPDTEAGHVWREEEEITHYHVEFLGEPHSHGWVCARDVKAFTAQSAARHSADGGHPVTGSSHSEAGGRATATSQRARACVRACVCACVRACVCMCVRVCAYVCVCTVCVCVCVCVCVNPSECVCTRVCMWIRVLCVYVCVWGGGGGGYLQGSVARKEVAVVWTFLVMPSQLRQVIAGRNG